jgi:hypothetical protein
MTTAVSFKPSWGSNYANEGTENKQKSSLSHPPSSGHPPLRLEQKKLYIGAGIEDMEYMMQLHNGVVHVGNMIKLGIINNGCK